MQAAVEHTLFNFMGRDHADMNLYIRPTLLELGQCMGDTHMGQGDQVIGQANGQFAAQMLVKAVDLGTKALKCAE